VQAHLRRALVLGGSGAVGAAVVRALTRAGTSCAFTYLRGEARAEALAAETGARPLRVDLRDADALREQVRALDPVPDLLVHCAVSVVLLPLAQLSAADWDEAHAVNVRSPFVALQALGEGVRDVVLVGALDRAQSLPLPLPFATTQAALSGMAMSLAAELGPRARVNLVALGPLDSGLSARLPPALLEDFRQYSALRRLGTAEEAASAIVWLALENTYMSGKVLQVNGGI
jgi:NAD(P)-dependent dehydrogenase (short-subunit alcohol dehydrogenase family)